MIQILPRRTNIKVLNALSRFEIPFSSCFHFWQPVGDYSWCNGSNKPIKAIVIGVEIFDVNKLFESLTKSDLNFSEIYEYRLQREDGYLFSKTKEHLKSLDIKAEDIWIFDRENNEKLTWVGGGEASLEINPEAFIKIVKPTMHPVYQIGDLVIDTEWENRFGRRCPGLVRSDELAVDSLTPEYGCLIVNGVWWEPPELVHRYRKKYRNEFGGWQYMTSFFDTKTFSSPDCLGTFQAENLVPFVLPEN